MAAVVPDWNEHDHEQREDHLHVRYRVHAERAEHQQLHHLQEGEVVDLPLGHFADVVGGRVRRLQEVRGSGQIKIQSTLRFYPHCPQLSCCLKEMTKGSGRPTHL